MHLVDTSHTTLWLENHDSKSKKRVVLSMKIEALIVDVKGEGRRDHGILMEQRHKKQHSPMLSRMPC